MEVPTRDQSSLPVIKCSSCGHEVGMTSLAEHQCATTPPPVSTMPPPPPRTDSFSTLKSMRSQRPPLPKIDPSVGFRTHGIQGELTPASSGHGSLASPVSADSNPRSPWPTARKGSLPGPRRPPSPELTNLDCAFPPFPVARAAPTRQRDKSVAQRSETKRGGSKDKGAVRSKRRPPLTSEVSSTATGTKSSDALPTLKPTRPTSPLSNEVKLDGPQNSTERLPGAAAPESQLATAFQTEVSRAPLPGAASLYQPPSSDDHKTDPGLSIFDFSNSAMNEPVTLDVERGRPNFARADTEPAYRSKRPAPIISDQAILPLAKSSTAPQPSPSGSFGRSLGKLFGRRRSQSATSGRDVVRQALSDEPDSFEQNLAGQGILSPGSERSFFTAEPSPLATSPLPLHEPAPGHEESSNTPEDLAPQTATTIATPLVIVEPTLDEMKSSGQVVPYDFETPQPAEPRDHFEHTSESNGSELIEALRRVSIDSASSYGSVGFSEYTTSSRSTAPHVESILPEARAPQESTLIELTDVDVPAPLRPKLPGLSPDSPTDPLFQQGRLSPIPDSGHQSQDSLDSIPSIHVEVQTGPDPEPVHEPQSPSIDMVKPLVPNKGVCRGCSQLILTGQKSVSSADGRLTGRYHKKCFVCHECKTSFPTAEFYVHNDHPYCAHHYHELENSLCATCGKGIEGLYMETTNVAGRGKEKHHPDCLKCTTCKVRLDHDYFELSGKVYCERDAFRLATMPKSHDNAPSRPSPLIREYISSGDPGLVKGRNFPERRTTRLMTMI